MRIATGRVISGKVVVEGEPLTEGATVTVLAPDGVEAVLRFIEEQYDFILLDIKMPKLDGINALRIMKKLRPEVPAVTYSGNAGSGEMAESVKAGALRCLTKPFELAQLTDEIRKYQSRRGGA